MDASLTHATNAWWSLARRGEPPRRRRGLDAVWHAALGTIARAARPGPWYLARGRAVGDAGASIEALPHDELSARTAELRAVVRRGADDDTARARAIGILAEHARRAVGLRAHPNQLACALALLDGRVAELPTGEGKTLAVALAACVLGWRGRGCHVLTANDYLATRDALDMAPIFRSAGLSVGVVGADTPEPARRDAYAASVTYSTAREIAADLLRDTLRRTGPVTLAGTIASRMIGATEPDGGHVLRGLYAAIVDEADALLIDEASTPLILAGQAADGGDADLFARADALARSLTEGRDYRITARPDCVSLTERGRAAVGESSGASWATQRRREELVELALHAHHLLRRDEHYALIDGAVVIIDAHTGRLLPDRSWRAGLHQAVEVKEGLAATAVKETLARTPFQRFFRRYAHLSGTTGTAHEVRREMWQMYHLPVVRLPSHLPCRRTVRHEPVLLTASAMIERAVEAIDAAHRDDRPVLVGTRSVGMSERISGVLAAAQLPHRVLNAVRHAEEAEVVARAGERGAITIATNMAGRGTDIRLGEGVAALGGLLVVCVESQPSARLERQLLGRAARQGDPGEGLVVRSLEDEVIRTEPMVVRRLAAAAPGPVRRAMVRGAQMVAEWRERRARVRVARDEERITESLEFAGPEA